MGSPAKCELGESRAARDPPAAPGEAIAALPEKDLAVGVRENLAWPGSLELSPAGLDKKVISPECSDTKEEVGTSSAITLPRPKSLQRSPAVSDKKLLILSKCADSEDEVGASSILTPPRTASLEWSPAGSDKKLLILPECADYKEEVGESSVLTLPRCPVCNRQAGASVCCRCAARLKLSLLDAVLCDAPARLTTAGTGSLSYCLECSDLVRGEHVHKGQTIILDKLFGSFVAWVTGKESWSSLFHGIQSDAYFHLKMGRPFLLHPPQGSRCEVCSDLVAPATLYGSLVRYCTIECWLSGGGAGPHFEWATALVREDFSDALGRKARVDAFCIQCACAFRRGEDVMHDKHDYLKVKTDFQGCRPRIKITAGHFMSRAWDGIKDLAGGEIHCSKKRLLPVRDEGVQRCQRCNLRLDDGGGQTCSLACALPAPRLLPRQLQILELHSEAAQQRPDTEERLNYH